MYNKQTLIILVVVISAVVYKCGLLVNKQEPEQASYSYTVTGPVKAKGNRLFGVATSESDDLDEHEAFLFLKSKVNVNAHTLGFTWTEIENSPEVYNRDALKRINSVYQGVKIILNVNPLETYIKTVPPDLEEKQFNDPKMIARFKKLLDVIFSELHDLEFEAFLIGNEVNIYLDKAGKWESFKIFYREIREYIKEKHAGIKVSIAIAAGYMEDVQDYQSEDVHEIIEISDIFLTTLYPTLDVLQESFDSLVNKIDKPIYIQEIGYCSSNRINSSEKKQGEFIKEMFTLWDKHDSKIKYLNYFSLHDFEKEYIEALLEILGQADEPDAEINVEIMTSLGLRTFSGRDKFGFYVLDKEAEARGW
jgi:hypothetical protein